MLSSPIYSTLKKIALWAVEFFTPNEEIPPHFLFMDYDHIETDKFILKIYPELDYLEYIIKPGISLDIVDAVRGKKETLKLYPDKKFFVLAESSGFFNLPRETRRYTSTNEFSDNTYCVAFYTENFSLAILGELYNKINKPSVPTKIFTNRQAAKKNWLEKQMLVLKQGTPATDLSTRRK